MKIIKTVVAFSEDLLMEVGEGTLASGEDRSANAGSQDLQIFEENAERLNLEAEDVLSYQGIP